MMSTPHNRSNYLLFIGCALILAALTQIKIIHFEPIEFGAKLRRVKVIR